MTFAEHSSFSTTDNLQKRSTANHIIKQAGQMATPKVSNAGREATAGKTK